MSDFAISQEHNAARLAATVAFADAGLSASRIDYFDASDNWLATVTLAEPCGEVEAGVLQLRQADPSGDMIAASGIAAQARWYNGDGLLVASGAVSDESGTGPFYVQGTAGTQIYAGGKLVLGLTEIS